MPDGRLVPQLRAPRARELIDLGAPVVVGDTPCRRHPALALEAMQRRVQRAFLDEQRILGGLLDPFGDRIAMLRAPAQGLEDEQLEAAAENVEFGFGRHVAPLVWSGGRITSLPLRGKGCRVRGLRAWSGWYVIELQMTPKVRMTRRCSGTGVSS